MVAESLIRDGDLAVEKDYAEGRYRAFLPGHLEPHYFVRGKHGEILSVHAIGLSVLVLPAYALGGYAGASFFMALLAAWLAFEIRELIRAVTDDETASLGGWVVAFCPPIVHYAGLVFSEIPAALIVAVVLRRGLTVSRLSGTQVVGLSAALSLLPWFNVRYAVISVLLAAFLFSARPISAGRVLRIAAPLLLSALAVVLYHWHLYGFFDPRRVYGRLRPFSWSHLEDGVPGLLLDQEFGLFVYAPVFVLALPGLALLVRHHRRLGLTALAVVGVVYATAASWHMWRGGFNPPARFLVPIVPVLAVAAAQRLRPGLGSAAALLCGWSLWTGLVGAAEPMLSHRDRQGGAPLFREWSGALEWTRLLPAYVLAEPDRNRLALVWGAVLLAAAAVPARRASARGFLVSSLVLLVGAGSAARLARKGGTAGRDAVRVVGRPAVLQPGWNLSGASVARWSAHDLDWGPFYEPHRTPLGATIGERLRLPPGRYRLEVEAELLGGPAPWVEVRVHPPRPRETAPAPHRSVLLSQGARHSMVFDVPPTARLLDLVIGSGTPFELRLVELSAVS
jgi:hypothetical protein